jgi:hypothetical protein
MCVIAIAGVGPCSTSATVTLKGRINVPVLRPRALRYRLSGEPALFYNTVKPHSSLGYRPPAPEAWLTATNKGHGEVETATRFPLLHTPDHDGITPKSGALH